jgi:hypothetical protein
LNGEVLPTIPLPVQVPKVVQMTILIVVVPPFDPADEWFD